MLTILLGTALAVCVWFYVYYFPRFLAWFGARRPQKRYQNPKRNRLAVIVPARNESKVIGDLLESLEGQTYPKEWFDVHVIVKEESDPSIALAAKHGAHVHIVPAQRCKGDALDACLKAILHDQPGRYDGYFILDADCLADARCLEEMNHAMASDCQVLLSKKVVKNYLDRRNLSLTAECNGLIWTIIDELGNRYKSDHGHTIMTVGTGLLLRSDFVEEMGGWRYRSTLTEDIELMQDCACRGIKTGYCSYALVYMEEALSLHETNKRRRRWLKGVVDSTRLYRKKLKKSCLTPKAKRDRFYVCGLDPVFGYIGTLTVVSLLSALLALGLQVSGDPLWTRAMSFALGGVGLIYLSFFVLTAFCLAADGKHIRLSFWEKVRLLFVHPVFYMGYIPIVAKALVTPPSKEWEAIARIDFHAEESNETSKA